jgi:hypothetical protein
MTIQGPGVYIEVISDRDGNIAGIRRRTKEGMIEEEVRSASGANAAGISGDSIKAMADALAAIEKERVFVREKMEAEDEASKRYKQQRNAALRRALLEERLRGRPVHPLMLYGRSRR